jgi:hypothetical protein
MQERSPKGKKPNIYARMPKNPQNTEGLSAEKIYQRYIKRIKAI